MENYETMSSLKRHFLNCADKAKQAFLGMAKGLGILWSVL